MPDRSTKLQRWLDLIACLVGRRYPITVDEVFERVPAYVPPTDTDDATALESSRRMFERDKEELRELGIPIETVDFTVEGETEQGYRLTSRDFYLPYLRLSGAVGESGPTGVEEVELTLSFDLGSEGIDAPPVLYAERPGEDDLRGRLRTLTDALTERHRVAFAYRGIYRGETTERDVAGYGLFFQRGHWYWIGHDALRDDVRVFRVDRMEEVEATTREYEVPDGFDLSDYRDREAWELGGEDEAPVRARVRFDFPRSLWAERNGRGALVEDHPDGSSIRSFEVRQVDPFLRWILSLEGDARILEPVELRDAFDALVAEVAALYDPGSA